MLSVRSLLPCPVTSAYSQYAPPRELRIRGPQQDVPHSIPECHIPLSLGKVLGESEFEKRLAEIHDAADREMFRAQWSKTRKYYEGPQKKGQPGGRFSV